MPESPNNDPVDFKGDLNETIEHILKAPDTEEDLKKKMDYARVTQREFTHTELDLLRESLQIRSGQEIIIRESMDARLALVQEIEEDTGDLTKEDLLDALRKVIQEEMIEAVLRVEDLKNLSVDELREMEKDTPGVLLFAFTSWGEKHANLEVSDLGNNYMPEVGDHFTLDFRNHQEAYWSIGAADLLPPEARGMKVEPADGGPVRESTHRLGLKGETKGGFYDEAGYIPVFTGDVITVQSVDSSIRDNYFNPETEEWDYEKYDEEHGVEEASLLTMPVGLGDDDLGPRTFSRERHGYSRSFENLREGREEWVQAAEQASDYFDRRIGVRVQPTSTFAVISKESNFDTTAVSSSGCMGLGQFAKGTWMDFIRKNRARAEQVLGEPLPSRKSDILALRTDPILNIYATTWYLARIGKRTGVSQIDSSTIHNVYLCYHEGVNGKKTLERYIRTGRGRLHRWQRNDPEGYWKFLNSYAGQVSDLAERYEEG